MIAIKTFLMKRFGQVLIIKNFNIAKRLLEDLRTNKKKPEEIFNLDLMAKGFALSDLLDSWHAMHWINMRWYYDPLTMK